MCVRVSASASATNEHQTERKCKSELTEEGKKWTKMNEIETNETRKEPMKYTTRTGYPMQYRKEK